MQGLPLLYSKQYTWKYKEQVYSRKVDEELVVILSTLFREVKGSL